TPGSSPAWAMSRKHTRHSPNLRYTERGRPQRWQRVYPRTRNLGLRAALLINAFLAIGSVLLVSIHRQAHGSRFLEREAQVLEQRPAFVVRVGLGDHGDVHAAGAVDRVGV